MFASGLNGPRGLKFGPDGTLYVAEAGTGGTTSTVGQCEQVPPPVGPYLGGNTARISKVDRFGTVSTVVSGLPSSVSPIGDYEGVGDVAFLNGSLYAVLAGAGCSHGNLGTVNSVIKVDAKQGTWKQVTDLSTFLMNHPAKYVRLKAHGGAVVFVEFPDRDAVSKSHSRGRRSRTHISGGAHS